MQWLTLWVAVEKLFMTEIGFDAAAIGLMAAVYAAFVPLIEIPSGIWADRWSRRNLLIIASIASMLSALIAVISFSVPMYFVSALVLGVFFALASGTLEALVYDTVLEEEGSSKSFEKSMGRVRLYGSIGGLVAALCGGLIAALTSLRMTYALTIFTVGISVWALLKFKEPSLHKMEVAAPLKEHIAITYKTMLQKGKLLFITLLVLVAMFMQALLEFGQLWLIALNTPTVFYGVAFGALTAALGFGGLLAGRIAFHKPAWLYSIVAVLIVSSLSLALVKNALVAATAQVVILSFILVISILFDRLLHDTIPSKVRSGVASGVSAFSWIVFVPFSLLFGWITDKHGIFNGGWIVVGLTAIVCTILIKEAVRLKPGTTEGQP